MPRTPDDPTKAQAWLTQDGPQVELELYVPRGNKGDPGGFNAGTELGTANLNEIMTPGLYKATLSANVTALNNYPIAGVNGTGVLRVYQQGPTTASGLLQEFVPVWGNQTGRVIFTRTYAASAWSAWRSIGSSRIDQTAGRAMYAWDELNAREQLVYGDTGLRNVTPDNGFVGTVFLRRQGNIVSCAGAVQRPPAGSLNGTFMAAIPAGFVPAVGSWVYTPVRHSGSSAMFWLYRMGTALAFTDSAAGTETDAVQVRFELTWSTAQAWPTVLPGTANGTIPNL